MIPFASTLQLLAATGLLIGTAMLIWGFIGRSTPTAPLCRRCRYNLTGITPTRCPECGTHLMDTGILHAVRVRRGRFLIAAVAILFVSSLPLGLQGYARSRFIDWYHYLPAGMLSRMAADNDYRAIRQLTRRLSEKRLKPAFVAELADLCTAQLGGPVTSSTVAWTGMATQLYHKNHLTPAQIARLYETVASVTYDVRAVVRVGDPIVLRVRRVDPLSGGLPFHVLLRHHAFFCASPDEISEWRASSDRWHLAAAPRSHVALIPYEQYGHALPDCAQRSVVCLLKREVYTDAGRADTYPPDWTLETESSFDVHFVPADAPDPVRTLTELPPGKSLDWFGVARIDVLPVPDVPGVAMLTPRNWRFSPAPFDFAGYLVAVAGDEQYVITRLEWRGGRRFPRVLDTPAESAVRLPPDEQHLHIEDLIRERNGLVLEDHIARLPDEVRLFLKPSRERTVATIDLFEMWHDDIDLGHVPLDRSAFLPVPTFDPP